MEVLDVLKSCKINGNVVTLPDMQLDRKLYQDVAKKIELIGGKWTRKVKGFLFPDDPTSLFTDICNGDNRNIKKEFQFFETPDSIADKIISLAQIKETDRVLEPSAGRGSLIRALNRVLPQKTNIFCYELMELNRKYLAENVKSANIMGNDFLADGHERNSKYDKIIANPPFNKKQYIDHIYKMYKKLMPNGILVTMAPTSWQFNLSKKEQSFNEWVNEKAVDIIPVKRGAFKSSGTEIETVILVFKN
ncbi:MAG: N-6 DNA methylase [bacterium]